MDLINLLIYRMKLSFIKWLLGKGYNVDVTPHRHEEERTELELIRDLMDNFDFVKVHRTMEALNWKWAGDVGYEIPSVMALRRAARSQLSTAINLAKTSDITKDISDMPFTCGSGGFKAIAFISNDRKKVLHLELNFIVTQWDESNIEN